MKPVIFNLYLKGGTVLTRRKFIQSSLFFVGGVLLSTYNVEATNRAYLNKWYMPDEGETHKRTWMS